ncbi:MAG: ribosome assembly RNA-binding protein YhbY [Clostridia bacterium]|jgi:RNA-binding protein|nr:ribosome assembly RNA-binding protein YhbY [Clostridia bacterium]MBQ4365600.1 ribosome assembly RNA-binding protein YhbY [Clostridia bacterium]MBQ6092765.1 ribosome assembly RNA-binding protein YhbY [Clostridia bacterium]
MTGKERAAFRARANGLEPLFHIGKSGMNEGVIAQTDDALRARELIKVKVLLESSPITPREAADQLAAATGAEVIQVIGGVIVLYRESPELREKAAQKEKNLKQAARRAREKALRESRSNKRVKVRVTKAKR